MLKGIVAYHTCLQADIVAVPTDLVCLLAFLPLPYILPSLAVEIAGKWSRSKCPVLSLVCPTQPDGRALARDR